MHEKFEKTQTGDACGIGDVIKLPSPFSHTQTHTNTHTHTHTHTFRNHVRSTKNIVKNFSQIALFWPIELHTPNCMGCFFLSILSMLLHYKNILIIEQTNKLKHTTYTLHKNARTNGSYEVLSSFFVNLFKLFHGAIKSFICNGSFHYRNYELPW